MGNQDDFKDVDQTQTETEPILDRVARALSRKLTRRGLTKSAAAVAGAFVLGKNTQVSAAGTSQAGETIGTLAEILAKTVISNKEFGVMLQNGYQIVVGPPEGVYEAYQDAPFSSLEEIEDRILIVSAGGDPIDPVPAGQDVTQSPQNRAMSSCYYRYVVTSCYFGGGCLVSIWQVCDGRYLRWMGSEKWPGYRCGGVCG